MYTFIDWILFILLALCVGYLLFYAIASKFYRPRKLSEARILRRFLVLFPAYKEDRVIVSTIRNFLEQEYPKEMYDVLVISDQMQPDTNAALQTLPICLQVADYTNSSKAKALTLAMNVTANESYDVVVIMDADNVTTPNFLAEINRAFESGLHAVQAHRTGKNMNTDIAVLDAISEEINNGFFRSGHNAIGLSAGLAGSGMAFDVHWFRRNVGHLQTSGEDKELEALLLKQRIHIEYLEQLPVYDEKTQKKEGIKNQRKRWIAAQYGALRASLPDFPKALIQGNIDYCDKILQWMLPPRLIQLAGVFGFTLLFTAIGLLMSLQSGGYEWDTISRPSCRHDHTCAGKVAEPEIRKSNPADSDTGTGNDSQYVPTERSEQKVYSYRARRRIKPHRERKEKAQMTRINTDLAAQPLKSVLASVSSVPKISL